MILTPQKVLITTNHLHRFGGSEMVTLELAEEFFRRGWQVDVFCNFAGTPFISEFSDLQAAGVRIDDSSDAFRDELYDLVWIQHSVLPPALLQRLTSGEARMPLTIWNHMSSYEPLELPLIAAIESKLAASVLSVSPETRNALLRFGIPAEKIALFQNPAPHGFSALPLRAPASELRRLLLVSNHPPAEVLEALERFEGMGGEVTRVGGDTPLRLHPSSLADVDAVITIGKTVQYALSAGLPVYEYDHFGGAGWLNEINVESEFETNFSGRTTRRTIHADQMIDELHEGFLAAQLFARRNKSQFANRFGLESQLNRVLERAKECRTLHPVPSEYEAWSAISLLVRNFYLGSVAASLKAYLVETELEAVRHSLSDELAEANGGVISS